MILTENLYMEKFAYEIKVGDKLNLHCDGWKVRQAAKEVLKKINKKIKAITKIESNICTSCSLDRKCFLCNQKTHILSEASCKYRKLER